MRHVRLLSGALILLLLTSLFLTAMPRFSSTYILPLLWTPTATTKGQSPNEGLKWYAPKQSWINDLSAMINGSGTHGFNFAGSRLPEGTRYGTYNYCNMPHVRREEYDIVGEEYELRYVEVIHRHHKRTPYASNTFPKEQYPWDCSGQGLFYYGQPLGDATNSSAHTYWSVYTSSTNPFAASGFNGTCQFPQITKGGLDDSWQHGKDLYGVYRDLLNFLPDKYDANTVRFRVTNNVITSQVSGMLISGMYPSQTDNTKTPLSIQPSPIDSLEPRYPCAAAAKLYSTYGVGSASKNWSQHLSAAGPLFATLDTISGIQPEDAEWHKSLDHYYDNLSTRQCDGKPLPCAANNKSSCVTQDIADTVYRLGQYEYSFIYRDAPDSLQAAVGSYGVWIAEVAQNMRDAMDGRSAVVYRHNVAHDGSVSRLLSVLQVEEMVWPGMGAEVVFEVYRGTQGKWKGRWFVRVLWGGRVLVSSNPMLGKVDMLDLEVLLKYFEGLVGRKAEKVVKFCEGV
jgi:acid phosphatase